MATMDLPSRLSRSRPRSNELKEKSPLDGYASEGWKGGTGLRKTSKVSTIRLAPHTRSASLGQ